MFSLHDKPDSMPYQTPLRYVAYVLQMPFREELELLQQKDIITQLGLDETGEWCNSIVLELKPNGRVSRLCLDWVRLNQVLI